MNKNILLNNGISIPRVGLGLYKTTGESVVEKVIHVAMEAGYRLFDTAAIYMNEKEVGKALRSTAVERGNYFVTSKVWNDEQGYDSTLRAFDKTLDDLGLDYLDIYLIHWPLPSFRVRGEEKVYPAIHKETWRALQVLAREGKVKTIGVSNFHKRDLLDILDSEFRPALNQIEVHPYFYPKELIDFCQKENILVQAWRPIAKGSIQEDPLLKELSTKYNKTYAQVVLRWHLQKGISVIPKSITPERIISNIDLFDFEISQEDMLRIDSLNTNSRSGQNPDDYWREYIVRLS